MPDRPSPPTSRDASRLRPDAVSAPSSAPPPVDAPSTAAPPTDAAAPTGIRPRRSLPPRTRRPVGDRQLLTAEGLFAGTATAIHQAFFVTLLVQLGIGSLLLGVYTALNGLLANASGLIGSTIQRKVTSRRVLAALA